MTEDEETNNCHEISRKCRESTECQEGGGIILDFELRVNVGTVM